MTVVRKIVWMNKRPGVNYALHFLRFYANETPVRSMLFPTLFTVYNNSKDLSFSGRTVRKHRFPLSVKLFIETYWGSINGFLI